MGERRLYTRAELERAIALKAAGATWSEVARTLGRTAASLQQTVSQYRAGRMPFLLEQKIARGDEMAHLAEQGVPVAELRRRFGRGRSNAYVHVTLARRGIDAEMLALYRAAPAPLLEAAV